MKVIPLNFGDRSSNLKHIDCEIKRSSRKTMAIHVRYRIVEVRSPMWASRREIRSFLESNKAWIEQKLREEAKRFRESLRIENGRKIFYRARERRIVFQEYPKQRIVITRDEFAIQGPDLTPSKAKEQVEEYLQQQASRLLPERARAVARHLKVSRRLREVKLRKTKTKWGHCTSTGVVQFNWLIMLAPNSIIDYMIAHEVCHLVHMNHSQEFWELVESICPDYDYYREWLQQHEHRLWL
ncbi:MAG: M48 family metallopeptidase [Gammaproteobacteria bacterium]|nr:M48 family metallopeptidase [Gammaproteobacteria bacterium]